MLIAKLSSNGNLIWAKLYGGVGTSTPEAAISDENGGLIVVGNTDGFGEGSEDAILF